MICQVVFDLPLEGPFDYLIPADLASKVFVGTRVKVSFGPRRQTGFVTGLIAQSAFTKLKPVLALVDDAPAFNEADLIFARDFASYYGCSLGVALTVMFRHKAGGASVSRHGKPRLFLHRCQP